MAEYQSPFEMAYDAEFYGNLYDDVHPPTDSSAPFVPNPYIPLHSSPPSSPPSSSPRATTVTMHAANKRKADEAPEVQQRQQPAQPNPRQSLSEALKAQKAAAEAGIEATRQRLFLMGQAKASARNRGPTKAQGTRYDIANQAFK